LRTYGKNEIMIIHTVQPNDDKFMEKEEKKEKESLKE
jgi:hypothetical protein